MNEDFSKMKPGEKGKIDLKKGWTIENEIEWTENYVSILEKSLHHQYDRLDDMYNQREWWVRFINYCRNGY